MEGTASPRSPALVLLSSILDMWQAYWTSFHFDTCANTCCYSFKLSIIFQVQLISMKNFRI